MQRPRPNTQYPTSIEMIVHALHPEDRVSALESMDATISRLRGMAVDGLIVPVRAEVGGRELIVESPDVPGTSLRELAIRRGRFPSTAVIAIARALTTILTILEDRGVAHGDSRLFSRDRSSASW